MKKIKLDPRASLSLEWSRKSYSRDIFNNYLKLIDSSSGLGLIDKCKSECGWYDEVVSNELFFIKDYIANDLVVSKEKELIIILGASKSLIALELLRKYSDKIDRVIEIDNQDMGIKEEFYNKFYSDEAKKIKCVTADITSPTILSFINTMLHEYYNDIPCIILLENISEYFDPLTLQTIISSFKSEHRNNKVILDYALPEETISASYKNVFSNIFRLISEETDISQINHYSKENLSDIFSAYKGELLKSNSMKEIELKRTGKNNYFKSEKDGWIECSVWKL